MLSKYLVSLSTLALLSSCGSHRSAESYRHQRQSESGERIPASEDLKSMIEEEKRQEEDMMREDKELMESLNQTAKDRYLSVRGFDMRSSRAELAPGQDSAILRSYKGIVDKLARTFERASTDIMLADASAFAIEKALVNDSPNLGVTAYRSFSQTVQAQCDAFVKRDTTRVALAFTQDNVTRTCQQWAERFWFRGPSATELMLCEQTALVTTKDMTDIPARWSALCSVFAMAPQFLSIDIPLIPSSSAPSPTPVPPSPPAAQGSIETGRTLFTMSCSGCHSGAKVPKAKTDVALRAAANNMNHIGRERYFIPAATGVSDASHILAYLKSLP